MSAIAKIDAHHHFWWSSSPSYPMMSAPNARRFFGDTDDLKCDFGPAEFAPLAQSQNVVKSVYVESGFHPAIEETAFAQALADQHGFPHAILARVDLAADDIERVLDIHQRAANFRGVRICVNWDENPIWRTAPLPGMMSENKWRRGYAALGARGLSADVMLLPDQMEEAAALADAFPDIPLIVNHTGLPLDSTPSGFYRWSAGLARLARSSNIWTKISGLGMAHHSWTVDSIRPFVDWTIDLFGADRCLFASNFPVDGLHASYDEVWDAFDALTTHRSPTDRAKLFHDTAARVYRI